MTQTELHSHLNLVRELLYDRGGLSLTNFSIDPESGAYEACSFELNGHRIVHRFSKITPTKTGQFVTLWKRKNGITTPFDVSDEFDFIVITSKNEDRLGQFIFPKAVLAHRGIISKTGKGGKRGIRVYPPWDIPVSKQAERTQAWQTKYFVESTAGTSQSILKELLMKPVVFRLKESKSL